MNCVRCKTVCPELDFTRNGKRMKTCNGCASKRKVHTSSIIDMDSLRKEHQEALRVQQMQMEIETMKLKHQLEVQQLRHEIELLKLQITQPILPALSHIISTPLSHIISKPRQLSDNQKRKPIRTVEQEQLEYKKLSNEMNNSSLDDLIKVNKTTSYRLETWKQHYFKWRVHYQNEKIGLSECKITDHNRLIMDPFQYITDNGELTEETITNDDFDKLVARLTAPVIDEAD